MSILQKYTVYNDLHFFAPHVLDYKIDDNAIYNGDIVDLLGCKKSDLEDAEEFLKDIIEQVGVKFVYGNHEMDATKANAKYIQDGIIFVHGHMQMMGEKKAIDFMNGHKGSGAVRRFFVNVGNYFRRFVDLPIYDHIAERCWILAKTYDCHTVVMGHRHPPRPSIRDYERKGRKIRIIILPRGKNELIYDGTSVKVLKTSKEVYLND